MRQRFYLCLAVLPLLTGCGDLLSLHALYTRADEVIDKSYEGKWQNKDDFLTVERVDDRYDVTMKARTEPGDTVKYEVHFLDVRGIRFADILPQDQIGHMILKTSVSPDGLLHMAFFDSEWLRQHVPHDQADIERERKQAVLTLKTPELRRLVAKYALEPRAYDKEIVFQRMR
jgi:hypothetical protein